MRRILWSMINLKRVGRWAMVGAIVLAVANVTWAGSIFLTGHDPDFHAQALQGAKNINAVAIGYVRDPLFNQFAGLRFLFVESAMAPPAGHLVGKAGIVASGFVEGVDFDPHTAATLNAALDLLGTTYDSIVVASDHGGLLTQAELDILNARSANIISFLNAGGGIYAMAESNSGARLTPGGGHFRFLPFVASTTGKNQSEVGTTVTAFGAGLGLTDADVSTAFAHNIFDAAFGLNIVDIDTDAQILSLAGRGIVSLLPGRMTGGGSVFTPEGVRFTHGFTLHCDINNNPNRLQVNWPRAAGRGSNRFHLENLTSAVCTDNPAISEENPVAGFDTYSGSGTGRMNGVPGAMINFQFSDAGEPGRGVDVATMSITPPAGGAAIVVSGFLDKGNHQAH